jgi:uncharacterized heparinase superfamily protein
VISRLLLLVRTVRHLRFRQLYYRPIRRLQGRLSLPPIVPSQLNTEHVARMRATMLEWGAGESAKRIARADEICAGQFSFLNVTRDLPSVPWCDRPVSHLWSFNLHYFDYALDLAWAFHETGSPRYVARFEELVEDWERSTQAGACIDAWNPYALSVRMINWSYALILLEESLNADFRRRLIDSLHRQAVFLSRRLEWHLLGNHLLKNLQALALAGILFDGSDACLWRVSATQRLWQELGEQFMPDGGHFERSPMYHAIALGDLLELLLLRDRRGLEAPPAALIAPPRMVAALACMSRPDGELRLFNDSANGIAPSFSHINRVASLLYGDPAPLGREQWELPYTGYYGAREGKLELMLDWGPIGPGYQPGHGHCDILSYELDYDEKQFVVDSGISGYEGDEFREYSRSTRAHNTLMIGGREQSEVWGTFRVARRATLVNAHSTARSTENGYTFAGGYRPYGQRDVLHVRRFHLTGSRLEIVDRVEGAVGSSVTSFVHFHPECQLARTEDGYRISRGNRALLLVPNGFDSATIRRGALDPLQGWFLPEFGKATPGNAIELMVDRNAGREFGYTLAAE